MKNNLSLTIGWFYPDLMSTYGDRGNIIVLKKRLEWRGIKAVIEKISVGDRAEKIKKCDLYFMGGAQDRQQEIVNRDLIGKKAEFLIDAVMDNKPALFICGAYQFMGQYYLTADGKKLKGIGLFNLYTENPGTDKKRLIGDIVVRVSEKIIKDQILIGFENHGGRTYLADKNTAFARVIKGYGNNGKDRTEGMIFHFAVGTYLHGPILPKNPHFADWLLENALRIKYGKEITLKKIKEIFTDQARKTILKRMNVL